MKKKSREKSQLSKFFGACVLVLMTSALWRFPDVISRLGRVQIDDYKGIETPETDELSGEKAAFIPIRS